MTQTFDELRESYQESEHTKTLKGGDTCQESEDCEKVLFELHHPRDPQFGSKRHKDAPETEVVCIHHGVVEAY